MNNVDENKLILPIDLSAPRSMFNYVNNGIVVTDSKSKIIFINSGYTKITGYSSEEMIGESPGILHSGMHDQAFYRKMWSEIVANGFWEGEIWNRRKSGEIYPELLTITRVSQVSPGTFYYVGIFSDISFLKSDINKQFNLAFYDPLTKLPNRSLYMDRVNTTIKNIDKNKKGTAAILYMDLDKFKYVNDAYGHCIGDKLLKVVGERLNAMTRPGDTIARVGGDEFTALLTSVNDIKKAISFSNRVVSKIEEPFCIDDHIINISISIGICLYPIDGVSIEKIIEYADKAMYFAKKSQKKVLSFDMISHQKP